MSKVSKSKKSKDAVTKDGAVEKEEKKCRRKKTEKTDVSADSDVGKVELTKRKKKTTKEDETDRSDQDASDQDASDQDKPTETVDRADQIVTDKVVEPHGQDEDQDADQDAEPKQEQKQDDQTKPDKNSQKKTERPKREYVRKDDTLRTTRPSEQLNQRAKTYNIARGSAYEDNRNDRSDRTERSDRPDRFDRSDRPERSDRPDRSDRSDRPGRERNAVSVLNFKYDDAKENFKNTKLGECTTEDVLKYLIATTHAGGQRAVCNVFKMTLTGLKGETQLPETRQNSQNNRPRNDYNGRGRGGGRGGREYGGGRGDRGGDYAGDRAETRRTDGRGYRPQNGQPRDMDRVVDI